MAKGKDDNWINKHLRLSIAMSCDKSEGEITKQFLGSLKELNLSDKNIKHLDGLEFAKNLTNLLLNNNKIKDTSKLSHLRNLTNLELSNNRIEDLSFLSKLTKLKSINLDFNNIYTIPNLSELKELAVINISNNNINDFSFVSTLSNNDVKIIACDQIVLQKPIFINYGEDYTLEPVILWGEDNLIHYYNVQVTGDYDELQTNERPSILYSISKITLKNICSDCIIKADFYHEVPFFKSGLLSGVLIQPLIMKISNSSFSFDKNNSNLYSIYGKIVLNDNDILSDKTITLIDSNGNKCHSVSDKDGTYKFHSLKEDRYTLLFPFLSEYNYTTPSLYVINLKDEKKINIDAFVSSK